MTKEEWLKYRVMEEMPLNVFWSYFVDNGGSCDFDFFCKAFPVFIQRHLHVPFISKNGPKNINTGEIIHKIYEFYDTKYCSTESEQGS
jgi:hypothetical protein